MKVFIVHVGFTEVPTSQVVFVGEESVFRCRHLTANLIDWRVNGSLVGQNPPPDITPGTVRDDDDSLVNTLTIIAHPEYNGTEVVCVAVFYDGSQPELSPAVVLQGIATIFRVSSRIFIMGGANVTLVNVSGGEDFGGTLVVLWCLYEAQIYRGILKHAFPYA